MKPLLRERSRHVLAARLAPLVAVLVAAGCTGQPATSSVAWSPATPSDQPLVTTTEATASPSRWAPAVAVDPPTMDARYRTALPLFEDPAAPLDVRPSDRQTRDGLEIERLTYSGASGEVVPAILVSPPDREHLPGLIMVYPGPGSDLLDRAAPLARLGMAMLLIDPPQVRRGGELTRLTLADRDEQIQLMLELRRGVDVLLELGADPDRLAYWGYSWGCAMGAQLAGVEHRIGSFVLMFCDGGVLEHLTGPDDAGGDLARLTESEREAWIAAMEPIEPLYFVRHAAPSALLIQAGLRDKAIPRVDAERLQAAASEPKEVRWYESDHENPPGVVWCDQAEWLALRLNLESSAIPACRTTS